MVGGYDTPSTPSAQTAAVEQWNGSSWTEVNDLNTAGYAMGTAGTTPSALVFCGANRAGKTEDWNGNNWAETSDNPVSRDGLSGVGTTSNALAIAGPATGATVEEWSSTSNTTKTISTD